jgi:hypothetical protein
MSDTPESGKTRRYFPTGRFVEPQERDYVIQLFGLAHSYPEKDSIPRVKLNEFLKELGNKYGHDWEKMSIAPDGELQYFEDVK